jgi:hypothetical protein
MEIIKDTVYAEMAATFQCLEIARLNEVLKNHGITDKAARQKICSEYFFDSGNFLDSGSFKSEGKEVFLRVCFAEREVDPEEGLAEPHTLYVPFSGDYFSWHEYAGGDIYWYFDEHNEDASEIETKVL